MGVDLFPARKQKLSRWFGKCPVKGCSTRHVVESSYVGDGMPIHYSGYNGDALISAGLWCPDHRQFVKWTQLQGRVNPDRECNGVCMAAVGPSCDCVCGGENHGRNHVG